MRVNLTPQSCAPWCSVRLLAARSCTRKGPKRDQGRCIPVGRIEPRPSCQFTNGGRRQNLAPGHYPSQRRKDGNLRPFICQGRPHTVQFGNEQKRLSLQALQIAVDGPWVSRSCSRCSRAAASCQPGSGRRLPRTGWRIKAAATRPLATKAGFFVPPPVLATCLLRHVPCLESNL